MQDADPVRVDRLLSLAYEGWCVIANAGWDNQSDEWVTAAKTWRDKFHAELDGGGADA